MYKLECYRDSSSLMYDKEFHTQEELVAYLEDELESDRGDPEMYSYKIYKNTGWELVDWKQKVQIL